MAIILQTPAQDILRDALERIIQTMVPMDSETVYNRTLSATTSQSADDIDLRIESLTLAMEFFENEVATQTLALRRLRNSLAKIFQLPPEVMVEIFDYYVHSDDEPLFRRRSTRLHFLALVSPLWAAITTSSPQLWRDIELPMSDSALATALRLSGSHPLNVYASNLSASPPTVWYSVSECIHRWRSAEFHLLSDVGLHTLESQAAPELISFTLDITVARPTERALELFAGTAPKLVDLKLRGVALKRWNSLVLSGLRSLSLGGLSELGPSFSQILDILRASPQLEGLSLTNILLPINATVTPSPIITLPHLTRLELRNLRRNVLAKLLGTTRTPHCTAFSFCGDDSTQHPPFPAIARLILRPLKTFLQSDRRVVFSFAQPRTVWFGRHVSPAFSVSLEGVDSVVEVAEWVTSLSSASFPLNIELAVDGANGFHPATLAVLRQLPDITTLKLRGCLDHTRMDNILGELSFTTVSYTTGDRSWLMCPRLQHIHFHQCNCSHPTLLLRLIQRRVETGVGPAGAAVNVTPIQSLEVSGGDMMDRRTFDKIESYLGSWVTWKEKDELDDEEDDDVSL